MFTDVNTAFKNGFSRVSIPYKLCAMHLLTLEFSLQAAVCTLVAFNNQVRKYLIYNELSMYAFLLLLSSDFIEHFYLVPLRE